MGKALPAWKSLETHFPAFDARTCAGLVGGKVKLNHDIGVFTNFCCIRVSRALNLSGQPVTYFKDIGPDRKSFTPAVSSGASGQWHVFRVRSLRKYMERTYGKGEAVVPVANYRKILNNRRGIVLYVVPGWDDASGHADCWKDTGCLWEDYGFKASEILFWKAT